VKKGTVLMCFVSGLIFIALMLGVWMWIQHLELTAKIKATKAIKMMVVVVETNAPPTVLVVESKTKKGENTNGYSDVSMKMSVKFQ